MRNRRVALPPSDGLVYIPALLRMLHLRWMSFSYIHPDRASSNKRVISAFSY